MSGPRGTPNGADRLAQIEAAAEDAEGGRWCSMETADVLALVEIARALEWYAERRNYLPPAGRHGDGLVERWIFEQDSFDGEGPGARARSALARLDRPSSGTDSGASRSGTDTAEEDA